MQLINLFQDIENQTIMINRELDEHLSTLNVISEKIDIELRSRGSSLMDYLRSRNQTQNSDLGLNATRNNQTSNIDVINGAERNPLYPEKLPAEGAAGGTTS